jgi:hypothetical protein
MRNPPQRATGPVGGETHCALCVCDHSGDVPECWQAELDLWTILMNRNVTTEKAVLKGRCKY